VCITTTGAEQFFRLHAYVCTCQPYSSLMWSTVTLVLYFIATWFWDHKIEITAYLLILTYLPTCHATVICIVSEWRIGVKDDHRLGTLWIDTSRIYMIMGSIYDMVKRYVITDWVKPWVGWCAWGGYVNLLRWWLRVLLLLLYSALLLLLLLLTNIIKVA